MATNQRAYSIRTRIKTQHTAAIGYFHNIREHIPLEQGLRHYSSGNTEITESIREHIPLEQGLRLIAPNAIVTILFNQRAYSIRTRIKTHLRLPRKRFDVNQRAYSIRTRIKTRWFGSSCSQTSIREHIPLEQGLRQSWFNLLITTLSESIFH